MTGKSRLVGAAAAGIFAVTAFNATPASASEVQAREIYQCYVYPGRASAAAYCSGSPASYFRVFVVCSGGYLRYGPWRVAGAGIQSNAVCPSGRVRVDDGVETYS